MDTLRRLKTWIPKARQSRKEERQGTLWQLTRAFGTIASAKDIHLGPGDIERLPITVENLHLNDTGYAQEHDPCFFQPLTQGELGDCPLDLEHEDTKEHIAFLTEYYDSHAHHSDSGSSASSISINLQGLFIGGQRIAPGNQHSTLRRLTEWIPGEVNLDDDGAFVRRLPISLKWELANAWRRSLSETRPHCMINVVHRIQPQEDLLRGEVLAIMSAMITQLQGPYFNDHLIIPVMVFSCMNGWKARILQAHPDRRDIVIRKTPFYDFSTWKDAERNFNLFLRLMGSTPTGDTKRYPVATTPAPVPAREEPATDTRTHQAGATGPALPSHGRPATDSRSDPAATIRPVVPSSQGAVTDIWQDPVVNPPPAASRDEEQAPESKAVDVQTCSQPSDTGSSPETTNIELRSECANSERRSSNAAESQFRQLVTETQPDPSNSERDTGSPAQEHV